MNRSNETTCPVCGFPDLETPVEDYPTCDCCGTAFGLDDVKRKHYQLRERWVSLGAPWSNTESVRPPRNWSALAQLQAVGLDNVPRVCLLLGEMIPPETTQDLLLMVQTLIEEMIHPSWQHFDFGDVGIDNSSFVELVQIKRVAQERGRADLVAEMTVILTNTTKVRENLSCIRSERDTILARLRDHAYDLRKGLIPERLVTLPHELRGQIENIRQLSERIDQERKQHKRTVSTLAYIRSELSLYG